MKLYFAYGANLNLAEMKFRCPDARPLRALSLKDWQLDFDRHATIRPCSGAQVPGCLWSITDRCEDSLDLFEGYPDYYTKQTLLQDGDEFMVYVMNSESLSPPAQGYVTTVAEGYMDWNLPFRLLDSAIERSKVSNYDVVKFT